MQLYCGCHLAPKDGKTVIGKCDLHNQVEAALLQVDAVKAENTKLRGELERAQIEAGRLSIELRDSRAGYEEQFSCGLELESQRDAALLRIQELEKILSDARNKADKAWRLFDHNQECPVSQDTEDEERKANCECSTGEVEAILDILTRNLKPAAETQKISVDAPLPDWKREHIKSVDALGKAKCGKALSNLETCLREDGHQGYHESTHLRERDDAENRKCDKFSSVGLRCEKEDGHYGDHGSKFVPDH